MELNTLVGTSCGRSSVAMDTPPSQRFGGCTMVPATKAVSVGDVN